MNKIKYIFLVLCIFLLTGCTKVSTNMEIRDDKSMNLSVQILFDEETRNTMKDTIKNKIDYLSNNGFKIEDKAIEFYQGYIISKEYENIDDLTYSGNEKIKLSNLGNESFDENKIFSVKKGLFYNTYTAYFEFDSIKDIYNNDYIVKEENSSGEINNIQNEIVENTEKESISSNKEKNDKNLLLSKYSYSVILPVKAIMSNSSNITNDGKTLLWELSNSNSEKNYVTFSFKMKNKINIVIFITTLVILFGIGIYILLKKKTFNTVFKNKPIFAEGSDSQIEAKSINQENVNVIQNIGTVANAVVQNVEKIEEIHEEVKVEEKVHDELIESKPLVANIESNIKTLDDYEIVDKEESMVKTVAYQNQNIIKPKESMFINNSVNENENNNVIVETKTEIDYPNYEEIK